MRRYAVVVQRTEVREETFYLSAMNVKEAQIEALTMAADHNFNNSKFVTGDTEVVSLRKG